MHVTQTKTTMTKGNAAAEAPLPRWARFSKKKDIKCDASWKQQEVYLGVRMYQGIAGRIDQALRDALDAPISTLVDDLMTFFQQTTYSEEDSERPMKRSRPSDIEAEEEDPMVTLFEMDLQERYPCRLLPLAMLHAPVSFLDRQEVTKHLIGKIQQGLPKMRPAVCWLRAAKSQRISHCGTLLEEVLRQCIEQESNPQRFQRLLSRTKSKGLSFSKALLTWAQYTVSFSSVLVVIDNVECIPGQLFQDFLQLLAELRSEHGLPLHVILLSPPGRNRAVALDSSTQSMEGIMIRDLRLPPSKVLYETVLERILLQVLPVTLDPSILRSIHESFHHHHASVVRAITMLKQAVAHKCTHRGAFLFGMTDGSLKDENGRIELLLHNSDRLPVLLEHAQMAETQSVAYGAAIRVLNRICYSLDFKPHVMDWIEEEFATSCFNQVHHALRALFVGLHQSAKLEYLVQMRTELLGPIGQSQVPPQVRKLLNMLNGIIILTSKAQNDEQFQKQLSIMFTEWAYNVFFLADAVQSGQGYGSNPFLINKNDPSVCETVDAIIPQIRKPLVKAILSPPPIFNPNHFHVSCVPRMLFTLIKDRVVISRDEEWFQVFVTTFEGNKSLEELRLLFALGVYQLCYCGLINEKRGGKSVARYERSALVWCSGD